jgi:hypothetical protein
MFSVLDGKPRKPSLNEISCSVYRFSSFLVDLAEACGGISMVAELMVSVLVDLAA